MPAWLRWAAVPAALAAAGTLAPGPVATPPAAPATFNASAWLGLTQPVFPAIAPGPSGAPMTAAAAPGVPLACASAPPTAPAPVPEAAALPVAPAADTGRAVDATADLRSPTVSRAAGPGSVLTDASAPAPDPLSSAVDGLNKVLGAVAGSLGATGAPATADPAAGLQSLLQGRSPTATTPTTTLAPTGTSSPKGSPAPAPGTPILPGPSPAPASSPATPTRPAGTSGVGVGRGIGCDLIGSGSVGTIAPGETQAQATAVDVALGLLGTPHVWGGESARGFDCSGLVQYSFSQAGVRLPRVAQDQYDAGPAVGPGSVVVPGDLVFFGSGPTDVGHVGMFVGDGLMVDAPHTGAVVRLDRIEGFAPLVGVAAPGGRQIA